MEYPGRDISEVPCLATIEIVPQELLRLPLGHLYRLLRDHLTQFPHRKAIGLANRQKISVHRSISVPFLRRPGERPGKRRIATRDRSFVLNVRMIVLFVRILRWGIERVIPKRVVLLV